MSKGIKKVIKYLLKEHNLNIRCELTNKMKSHMCVILPKKRLVRISNDWAKDHRDEIAGLLKICFNHISTSKERELYLNSPTEIRQWT